MMQTFNEIVDRFARAIPDFSFVVIGANDGMARVDMFSIDVEGYDFNIIKMIDFERGKLGEQKQLCERLLRAHGYQLHHHGLDTLAYLDSRED
ncbi:hypothetical protein AWY79_02530 [Pseudodesulfovibrio indicus]|uniref:Methyltransferase FkbM domain-containing protein n=2 Tax=Pseudodesulfovibrio indicus TaxID=1716143 RepID=A0ABM5YRV7_9BACT|nr:hypothetical protein AWY79_02530 [Pseudodesulfovibrio indicus]